ncbi:MAG: flagellar protein FlgN [Marmoricola sp.]
MENLSLILWRERDLLETLLFKLEEEQLVLASGRERWLARAAKEVEAVLDAVRDTEVLRAVAADEAAASVGLSHNPSLSALAAAVGEPWHTILLEHRDAFVQVTREVKELAHTNRTLLTAGYRAAQETLLSLGGSAEGYGHDGAAVVGTHRAASLFDGSL